MKIYLAAPIVGITEKQKSKIKLVKDYLNKLSEYNDMNIEIYDPSEHGVPNAWGMSPEEWSSAIFALDIVAINNSDWIVALDFGRHSSGGTSVEVGYAFGKNKSILLLFMNDENENENDYSVMMKGCSTNCMFYYELFNVNNINNIFVERGRLKKSIYN